MPAFTPGWQIATQPLPRIGALGSGTNNVPSTDAGNTTFDFASDGTDDNGWLKFAVKIGAGGSPAGIAEAKFTPLFNVQGKDSVNYVTDAFFQSNPTRRANTIQPGDSFTLSLPPDTFIVASEVDRQDPLAPGARYTEYVSDHGDVLRYYQTDPFPVRYEVASGTDATSWTLQLHPEMQNLVRAGRVDAVSLARLMWRVPDPDLLQVESARQLLAQGAAQTIVVDRSVSHLDTGRQYDDHAIQTEPVAEPGRQHLVRRIFPPDGNLPFMAVEDAARVDDDREGTVVRIEYRWDGQVRVIYRTGIEDTKGKREPYKLRENERWEALYSESGSDAYAQPVKWGAATPSDFPPFPSARDPHEKGDGYNFLLPGRYLVLTFQPTRFAEGAPTDTDMSGVLASVRKNYGSQIAVLSGWLDQHVKR
jgi:hypothetical protein